MVDKAKVYSRIANGVAGVGAILTGLGVAKIAAHIANQNGLDWSICGTAQFTDATFLTNSAIHCWGCAAVALGLAMLAASIFTPNSKFFAPFHAQQAGSAAQ